MTTTSPGRHLAEWYRVDLTDESVAQIVAALECAATSAKGLVRLVISMAVPSDEVLYVVFAAASAQDVGDVCEQAGLPPQRMTADVDARIHAAHVG